MCSSQVRHEVCQPFLMAGKVSIFDVPQEDVTFRLIFPHLSVKQLFRCRRVCTAFRDLCDEYFKCCRTLDCSSVSKRLTTSALKLMTKENTHLRELVLRDCCAWLHEYIVVDVLRENRRLEKLDLSGCPRLTNITLFKLTQYCPKLVELNFRQCIWVAPSTCLKISLSCKDLEFVDFSDCPRVNDECVCILTVNLRKLGTLILNGCSKVTDASTAVMAMRGSRLRHLGLGDCPAITDAAFEWLEFCEALEYLDVRGCNLNENSASRLQNCGVIVDMGESPKSCKS